MAMTPMSMAMTPMSMAMTPMSMAMTYTISGENNGLDFSQLRQLLKDSIRYGFHFIEKPVSEKVHISFGSFGDFMIHGKLSKGWHYDPAFFKQKSAIKNTLGNFYSITNKSELYDTIKKLIPNGIKYLPKKYDEKEFETKHSFLNSCFPLIIKKDNSYGQKGVIVVSSKEEYKKAKETLYKLEMERASIKKVKPSYKIAISEYIANPLLLDGKKIHLRVYYLLSIISGISRCVSHDEYRIYIAEEKYKKGDWLNPNIHISGVSGKSKNRRYYWPDDISANYDIDVINKNMNHFNKFMCMILAMSNMQNYAESYAGYNLYGADILITDEYQPYLLEINRRPGFRFSDHEKGWEDATRKFSYRLFSFILNFTVFPFFGIVRYPIYQAEFIGNGSLTPYANILTGDNKCILIPYSNATPEEIQHANQINFFNKEILHSDYIFLISLSRSGADSVYTRNRPRDSEELKDMQSYDIIGYLILDNKNFIKIAIIEEFQNRGIATAMIAQFLEIYHMQHFNNSAKPIYIDKNNICMASIAKKLHL
jgi:hypothetical protein